MTEFTHLDESGDARMVDVAAKDITDRRAVAEAFVRVSTEVVELLRGSGVPKGDALAVARIAAIGGTKRTADLIPLCHPIAIHGVEVEVDPSADCDEVLLRATVRTSDRTGIEMEALTAVTIAGLTVIDMTKAVDRGATMTDVRVESKSGGRSGTWTR